MIGFVTLEEADAYLEYEIGSDRWNENPAPVQSASRFRSSVDPLIIESEDLEGASTLLAGQYVYLENYNAVKLVEILSTETVRLASEVSFTDFQFIQILEESQYKLLKDIEKKKTAALTSAYRLIQRECTDLPLPEENDDENLKSAQILIANRLFEIPKSKLRDYYDQGVDSVSIGDVSYDLGRMPEIFPQAVRVYIEPYSKQYRPVRVGRAGMRRCYE